MTKTSGFQQPTPASQSWKPAAGKQRKNPANSVGTVQVPKVFENNNHRKIKSGVEENKKVKEEIQFQQHN